MRTCVPASSGAEGVGGGRCIGGGGGEPKKLWVPSTYNGPLASQNPGWEPQLLPFPLSRARWLKFLPLLIEILLSIECIPL